MSMKKRVTIKPMIGFDESGNTGANLLDPTQPVFALASVNLPVDEARTLVRATAGNAGELHFVQLRRSTGGRQRIIEALNADVLAPQRVRLSVYHKPFMVTTKIVDLLIEPMAHEDGVNLYEGGANIAMSNVWHLLMPYHLGADRYHQLQAMFVTMVRERTWQTVTAFFQFVGRLYDEFDGNEWQSELALLLASQRIGKAKYYKWSDSDLDPAIPSFYDLASFWTGTLRTEFEILHDVSRPLANEQAMLEVLMSTEAPTAIIGFDRRTHAFPIRAKGIQFVDSSANPQVQLADLVASAAAFGAKRKVLRRGDGFVDAILESKALSGQLNIVWPSKRVTPQELGTVGKGGLEPFEYMAKFTREARRRREELPHSAEDIG